ncbi:MAG: diguanylate cyclase [Rhodospirillaceae bacterium]|nr:MAG: diguanylate cyclase [Rhodospirillaceae bacterium]
MNDPLVSTDFISPENAPATPRFDTLFAAAGALAEAAFPACLADGRGQIHQANAVARSLLDRLDKTTAQSLAAKIAEALDANAARQVELVFPEDSATNGTDIPAATLGFFLLPFPEDGLVLLLGQDVTFDRNLREALIESRQRYKELAETASDFVWETGADGCFTFLSSTGALGFPANALLGRNPASLLFDATETELAIPFHAISEMTGVELWFRDAKGSAACLSISARPLGDETGIWKGARGACQDITEMRLHQMEIARFQSRERLLLFLVRTIRDEVEPDRMLARAAAAIAHATGAEGCRIVTLMEKGSPSHGAEFGDVPAFDVEKTVLCDPKTTFPAAFSSPRPGLLSPTSYQGRQNGAVSIWREARPFDPDTGDLLISVADQLGIANEQIAIHHRLVHLSTTDALTGLLNRRAFHDKLNRRFARAAHGQEKAALFYLDLDNFKQTNDHHGHGAGDAALRKTSEILLRNTRGNDLVARHGGDEFVLWLENTNAATAEEKARALLDDAIALAEFSGGTNCPLGFSIGIAIFDPDHGETLADLLSRADAAMYLAKQDGKGGYRLASATRATPR